MPMCDGYQRDFDFQNGWGWVGLMCGLDLELVVRLHEGDRTIIISEASAVNLLESQTSLVQGTAFWNIFVQATGHETTQFVHHNLLVYTRSKRCSVEKYEFLRMI